RDGYYLSGWKDSEGNVYELGMLYYSDLGDNLELTAVWTEKTKITYSPGEGKGDAITDYVDSDQTYNLRSDADFTRDGYYLTGWKDSEGNKYDPGAAYDHSLGNLALTAVWTEKIKISYLPGEGKGTAVTDSVAPDETYSLRAKADFTRDGYKLSGWKDKSGNEYALGASYDLKKGNVELTAMWEAVTKTGKAKIKYAPGEGSGTAITDDVNFKYVSESKSEDYNLRKTADFTRKGYKLIGWKAADGTEYALGASYNLAGGDLSLTAVWEKVKEEEKTEQKKGTLTISVNRPVYFGAKIKVETKTNSNGKVTLEYKKQDEPDSAYTDKVPEALGKYTVRAKLAGTKKYTGTSVTEDFEIVYLDVPEEPYKYTEIKDAAGTITDLKITAPEGYRISVSASGPFGTEVSYLAAKAAGTIFLRRDTDGAITSRIVPAPYTVEDKAAEITVEEKILYGMKYSVGYTAHTKAKLSLSFTDTKSGEVYKGKLPEMPGHYMARLTGPADGFYKAVDRIRFFDINYLEKPDEEAVPVGTSINQGWYVSDVYVKAPKGFKISTSLKGTYEKEILYNESIKKLYYRRDSDGATTDGIKFSANVRIDKEKPSIKSVETITPVNGGKVFSNGLSFTIYDENLKEVKLDGKPQNVKDGSCIIKMPADKKACNVNVIAYDEAGNKYELKFTMYPAWMKTRTIPAGMDVYLENGIEYNLESKNEWTLKDDSTVYSGGAFYVKETNDYKFNVKTK
ncbi:MAG: InlB B-repeat-containing protein, partial [Lachnospiraceae bacterium]|nr:InlB B-repeat-containing protein [Lachnospiraceae bacterium]